MNSIDLLSCYGHIEYVDIAVYHKNFGYTGNINISIYQGIAPIPRIAYNSLARNN
jgi:hypothetical protein